MISDILQLDMQIIHPKPLELWYLPHTVMLRGDQHNSALDDMIYNDVIDNALLIDIDDPLGDYNTKMWRCYTSLGTINMPEVVKVAFRKPVMRFDANNILIELYEIAPVYGRIWFNKYAKDQGKWIGWKSITPQ